MAYQTLLTNQTTNGSGTGYPSPGGQAMLIVSGTFDGATVTPEITHDSTDEGWVAINDDSGTAVAITAATNDGYIRWLPSEYSLRLTVSSAGGSTDISAKVVW